MQMLLADYAQGSSDRKKLGIRFAAVVPDQLLEGTAIGARAAAAYGALHGVPPEASMERFGRRGPDVSDPLAGMAEARQRFLDLVTEVRPELHRYCTRMTGSVFDGEDVVQDTLLLQDVRGLSLEETAAAMGTTVPAVKAALGRARAATGAARAGDRPPADDESLDLLRRYAHLFNQHDWDGLRTLFGPDTELDVVSRHRRRGRAAAEHFTRYEAVTPTEPPRLVPGWADGVLLLAVFRLPDEAHPAYFIRLDWREGRVARVRDCRFVPYLADAVEFIP